MTSNNMQGQETWIPEWTFGDKIRKVRRRLGLGQKEFAKLIGERPNSVAAWELDSHKPREFVQVCRNIERETGVPATWLLGLEGLPRLDSNQQPFG